MHGVKLFVVVIFVGFVRGTTSDIKDQPATGSEVVVKLKQPDPEDYFAGGDVCRICKALATIAYAGYLSNSSLGYRRMDDFCSDLGNQGVYIGEKICQNQMNIIKAVIETRGGIVNPVQLCSFSSVGACDSVKGDQPALEMAYYDEDLGVSKSGCGCMKYNCGCCAHVEFDRIKINDTVCTNFSYLPDDYGISFTVTLDDKTLINKTVSARNPPPICVGVPKLKLADICLRFTKLNVTNSSFTGCVEIEAELAGEVIGKKQLGCFKIPLKEAHLGVGGPVPLKMRDVKGEPMLADKMASKRLFYKSSKPRPGKKVMFYTESRIKEGRLGF